MLMAPKGYEYWKVDAQGNEIIADDAPEWAKKEFEEYHQLMEKSVDPDADILIQP